MPNSPATIYVRDPIDVAAKSEVCVVGKISSGCVREGMRAYFSFGGFSVNVSIKRVEPLPGCSANDEISLALDIPNKEDRLFWKEICEPGAWFWVIEDTDNG